MISLYCEVKETEDKAACSNLHVSELLSLVLEGRPEGALQPEQGFGSVSPVSWVICPESAQPSAISLLSLTIPFATTASWLVCTDGYIHSQGLHTNSLPHSLTIHSQVLNTNGLPTAMTSPPHCFLPSYTCASQQGQDQSFEPFFLASFSYAV